MTDNQFNYTKIVDLKRLDFIKRTLEQNVSKQGKILDVGCGNGIISLNLGTWGFNVLGIDVSDKAIEAARQKNNLPNVKFEVKSAEELSSDGTQYDAIICSEVIEHLHNPSELLGTLHKSLKSTGILIVTVPNGRGPRESLVTKPVLKLREKNNWLWKLIVSTKKTLGYSGTTTQSSADNLDHVQFFSKSDLIQLLQRNKFSIISFGKSNFIDDVFPFSFFANRLKFLQRIDCKVADYLPYQFTGGFNTVWKKQTS